MFTPSYFVYLSTCVLAVLDTRVVAIGEFCHGWIDERETRRERGKEGFYCPERGDRRSAVICCGRCDYRYCCSDSTARLDQGTCSDSDRKLQSKAEVEVDRFSTSEYPVYVPFLIVGSAFLALLLFGGTAYFLYNRQSSSESVTISTTTATVTTSTAMTTTAACGSSTSLGPHGNSHHRHHGNQAGGTQHLGKEGVAVAPPPQTCAHCSSQYKQPPSSLANQHASPPANQHANQHAIPPTNQHTNQHAIPPTSQHTIHRYPLTHPPPPPLHMPPTLRDQHLPPTPHHHFHTHPQLLPHSRAVPSPQSVEPRHVCRPKIPECLESELECVNNATLSAIIRQLSSLSKHAEDVFAELCVAASGFYWRTVCLQERVERLALKVTQLDSSVEEVSLQDIHLRKAFHSGVCQDQQVLCKDSMPMPVAQMYRHSDQPPPLSTLTPYREDGVEALRLYSDPCYFFELWKERMTQATEEKRMERRRQRTSFPDLLPTHPIPTNHRPSQPLLANQPAVQPQRVEHEYHSIGGEVSIAVVYRNAPVEPPSPHTHTLSQTQSFLQAHTLAHPDMRVQSHNPTLNGGSPANGGGFFHLMIMGVVMATVDARSDLLAAIRVVSIQLKKVQEQKELRAKHQPIGHDVAAILSRRVAMEISDSEEGEESDGEGGRGWSD
ncbi:hypothetical protein ACEWY4_009147 [Coilia grayii]|uniref:Wiskott-Aldrich syndrome protein family member n=1 Tax=Coilia grayii TaxID=363190 RepID=A0ABD1K6A8_9TELE